MKFAHDFKASLASQDFPSRWVDHAIPYSQLKKCLKKVSRELRDLGLDPETLRNLLDANTESPVAAKYKLNAASDPQTLCPKLIVQVHLQNGVPIDASLTANSREFLSKISASLSDQQSRWPLANPNPTIDADSTEPETSADPVALEVTKETSIAPPSSNSQVGVPISDHADSFDDPHAQALSEARASSSTDTSDEEAEICKALKDTKIDQRCNDEASYEVIEVPLVFDGQFFDMLQSDVLNLDAIQAEEEKNMTGEVVALGKEVGQVAKPTRFSKSDMTRWRQIFELYLDAEIFFATHEQDHGVRSGQVALRQLQWFQNQVEKQKLTKDFKLPESRAAYARFLNLNASLLKNLQFQELNKTAVTKILKKFDKRTALGVSRKFPSAVHSDRLLARSIAQDVCAQMSQELVSVVPQLNDYLCPVCFSVAYMPIRLDCQHVFCIRCIIKIQRRRERNCPLCRSDVVLRASSANLDYQLVKYMKKYFPKEVKEKQRANEIERGIEDYGPGYVHQECTVM